jgi:hypothetical protein
MHACEGYTIISHAYALINSRASDSNIYNYRRTNTTI